MTYVCRCGRLYLCLWSGNESAGASASVIVSASECVGENDDVRECCRESGNVCVRFSKMSQVESCHVSNGSFDLCPDDSSLDLVSRIGVSLEDHLRMIDSICP